MVLPSSELRETLRLKLGRKCTQCKLVKTSDEFHKYSDGSLFPECRKCHSTRARDVLRKLRKEIITHYGARCVCCGEVIYEFLTLDHKDGGGGKHKEAVGRGCSFLYWIKRNNFPATIQVLCFNCNCGKGALGVCPHTLRNRV